MRITRVTTLVLRTAGLLAIAAAPAMAQVRPSAPPTTSTSTSGSDEAEIGVGYSFLHLTAANAPLGFDAFYTKPVRTMSMGSLGYLVDFSVNHGSAGTAELANGGVRVNFKSNMKAKVYAKATAGFSHIGSGGSGESQLMIDFGAGVQFPWEWSPDGLRGRALASFEVDFPHFFISNNGETGVRVAVTVDYLVGSTVSVK